MPLVYGSPKGSHTPAVDNTLVLNGMQEHWLQRVEEAMDADPSIDRDRVHVLLGTSPYPGTKKDIRVS